MVIRPDDRVATVIRDDESLIDVFASLSPAFERLRNPAMRKVMARLVTVEQVARMAGIDAQQLVDRLNAHRGGASHAASDATTSAGDGDTKPVRADATPTATRRSAASPPAEVPSDPVSSRAEPPALAAIPAERRIVLDVREDLRAGNEPFRAIMAALRERPANGALAVRAIFEPVPLYAVMRKHGLTHYTEELGPEDWRVWFYADTAVQATADTDFAAVADRPPAAASPSDDVVVLDVRNLEPPEPMMRTLAALEQLPPGGTLVQLNVRVPQFLLPLLEERGFTWEIREQSAELVRVFIRRRTA
jgi:uncharacterized protein (DUF2249 family)